MATRAPRVRGGTEAPSAVGRVDVVDAATLFRDHARFVDGFLGRLGVHGQDRADLVQDVFLAAHRKGGYRPGEARATTWLAGIALGLARNLRRRGLRRARAVDVDASAHEAADSASDPERTTHAREALALARAALDELPETQRVVIVLHELEGESLVSIAAGLDVPVGTLYARLHRGRKAFRERYAALLAAQEGGCS